MEENILVSSNRVIYLYKALKKVYIDWFALSIFLIVLFKTIYFFDVLLNLGNFRNFFTFDDNVYKELYIYIPFILLFMSFSFLFSGKVRIWSLIIFDLIYSIVLIGDVWHYRAFKSFLSLHLLSEFQNLNNLSGSVLSMARTVDIYFLIDLVVLIFIGILRNNFYSDLKASRKSFAILSVIPLSLILTFHFMYDYHDKNYSGPQLFKTAWIPFYTMRNLSPLGYHIYDTAMYIMDETPFIMSDKDKNQIDKWFEDKKEGSSPNEFKGIFQGKNLILIQVESLENFVINQKYENQELTPSINKLLNNSLYFTNFFEQVNNGTSSDADLMINTSVYPVRRGSTFFRFPDNTYNTLPMLFKEKGYTTKALHSDYGYYWNVSKALANFGFDEFRDADSFEQKDLYFLGLTDECFLSQTAELLAKEKNPFMAFTVTCTSHSPFEMPEAFKNLALPEAFDKTYMGGYFQSVNYTDKQIGMFIDRLDKEGLLDNTVIAIYGDHTGVHKFYSDSIDKLENKESWWDNGLRVPLVIYSKGLQGKVIDTKGGQIDVLPTLAYAFGIDENKYENTALGRNLLNTSRNFALLADGRIVGSDSLSEEEIKHVSESFEISDKLLRANYFKKK